MNLKNLNGVFFILGFILLIIGFLLRSFIVGSGNYLIYLPLVLNMFLLPAFYFFTVGFSERKHTWQQSTYLVSGILFLYLLAEALSGGKPFGIDFLMKIYGVVLGMVIIIITLIPSIRKRLMKQSYFHS